MGVGGGKGLWARVLSFCTSAAKFCPVLEQLYHQLIFHKAYGSDCQAAACFL